MLAYVFLILLVKAEAEHARAVGSKFVNPPRIVEKTPRVVSPAPSPSSGQMSFFSVYCGPGRGQSESEIIVHCKVGRAINNLDERITILGNVYEDVVGTAGQILIPAGSKVSGRGFCDPERGRILGRGRWTFYVSDHQIGVDGTLLDETKREGLPGAESETGQDDLKIKKAIYRDGLYLYVPVGTEFVLKLTGHTSVTDLDPAFDDE
jgi:hypothetical protein